ncbi:hypothetical protein ACOME3_003534 [Neoechinorhynchus agilis]
MSSPHEDAIPRTMLKFPPFYTLQPNLDTRHRQMQLWSDVLLDNYKHQNITKINIGTFRTDPIFQNQEINRCVDKEFLDVLQDYMISTESLVYSDKTKSNVFVLWKSIPDWMNTIENFIKRFLLPRSIVTIYQMITEHPQEDFHQMDNDLMFLILRKIEQEHALIEIIENEDGCGFKVL